MRNAFAFSLVVALAAVTGTVVSAPAEQLGLGRPATQADIARFDIDISPDGAGLPIGHGDAAEGSQIFHEKCLRCHGAFIKMNTERWAYATSLFDYVRRAMPPDRADAALASNEVYALVAFLLSTNAYMNARETLDNHALPRVHLPRVKDFISSP